MNWIILISLAAVWLDIFVSNMSNAVVGPVLLWAGIIYFIQKQQIFQRMLWLLAFGAWSLFVVKFSNVLILLIIFLIAGEALNYFFSRFIPAENKWLRLITVIPVVAIALISYMLAAFQYFGLGLIWPLILMCVVSAICVRYVQKKEK